MKLLIKISMMALLLISNATWADTHCKSSKTVYFACALKKSSKIISLCGSNPFDLDVKSDNKWLQYRFGKLGKPELIFPKSPVDSLRKFQEDWHYHKAMGNDNSYIVFKKFNSVYTILHLEMDGVEGKKHFDDVKIVQDKLKEISLTCKKPNINRLREAVDMINLS